MGGRVGSFKPPAEFDELDPGTVPGVMGTFVPPPAPADPLALPPIIGGVAGLCAKAPGGVANAHAIAILARILNSHMA